MVNFSQIPFFIVRNDKKTLNKKRAQSVSKETVEC
jgi:hypothetical protein